LETEGFLQTFQLEGEGKSGFFHVDQTERQLTFSWEDFELMIETLHGFVNEPVTKLPRQEVLSLANRLTVQWHSKDIQKQERPD